MEKTTPHSFRLMKFVTGILLSAVLAAGFSTAYAASDDPDEKYLVPLGNTIGISIQTDGVLVVGVSDKDADGHASSPARDAGLLPGDIITQFGSAAVASGDDIRRALAQSSGEETTIHVTRGDGEKELTVTPSKGDDGAYQLGVWLRDGLAGIGTLTFYDPDTGVFGSLGHSISDVDTGVTVPLRSGFITSTSVVDVVPGQSGAPGQLVGSLNSGDVIGTLDSNTDCGIFGTLYESLLTSSHTALPAAEESEIKTGPAVILSNVAGDAVCAYDIEISRIYTGNEADGRSMMITVTDPELLNITGGIVQGMSGSPIIQDGKLIGAVTHVLINNPAKGYGVSVQMMLDNVYSSENTMAA